MVAGKGGFSGLVDNSFRHLRHDPTLPSIPKIVDLLGKGFLIESIANLPDLTMIQVVQHHATTPDPSALNRTIAERFHSIKDPWATIQELGYVLPRLPNDDTSRSRSIANLVMILIATVIVALRFYVRKFIGPEIRREDWWCLVALFWSAVLAATMYVGNFYGSGRHLWTLTLNEARSCAIMLVVNEYLFSTAHFFIKFNFLVFYYRLSPDPKYRLAVKLVGFHVCYMTVIAFFVVTFQCRPVAFWNAFDSMKCINKLAAFQAHGAGMCAADFMLLALPIWMVTKVRLQLMEKMLLVGVFATGAVISIVTVIRVVALRDWLASNDWSYDANCPWVVLEIALSVIISCAPALKRLFFRKPGEAKGLSKISWTKGGMFRPTRAAAIRVKGRTGSSFWKSTVKETRIARDVEDRITEVTEDTNTRSSKTAGMSSSSRSGGGTTISNFSKEYDTDLDVENMPDTFQLSVMRVPTVEERNQVGTAVVDPEAHAGG